MVAHQAPLPMGLPRQECWSGLPFPSVGDLPNAGIEPGSPGLQAFSLLSEPPAKPKWIPKYCLMGPLWEVPPTNYKMGPVSSGQVSFTIIKCPRTWRQGGKADKILVLNKPEFDSWFCAFWHNFLISVKRQ